MKMVSKGLVAMIPARSGSKRIPGKNTRNMLGRPLICWAIDAAINSGSFDRIVVNSDSDEIGWIAQRMNVEYYRRRPELASDAIKNEDFVYDFFINVPVEHLVMVNPTSPLITAEDIKGFTQAFIESGCDSYFAVRQIRAQGFIEGRPFNFNPDAPHVSSQELAPVEFICWGLTGWRRETFIKHYEKNGYAAYCGRTGTYPLSAFSSQDIDYEEDFRLAEAMMQIRLEDINGFADHCHTEGTLTRSR